MCGACLCVFVCVCVRLCAFVCICVHLCAFFVCLCVSVCVCMCLCESVCVCVCVLACIIYPAIFNIFPRMAFDTIGEKLFFADCLQGKYYKLDN